MTANITLTVLGARGSMPVSGREFIRFGGHTTSFVVVAGDTTLLLDCGTGVVSAAEMDRDGSWDILLSHYHNDHLQGLHFFRPLYEEGQHFTFYGLPPEGMSLEQAITTTFEPPFFPISLDETPSTRSFVELNEGTSRIGEIDVTVARLHHPQGVAGYRFASNGSSIVVATDHEAGDEAGDVALEQLGSGADVLVHDAQYTGDDYRQHRGWGHSTWEHAVEAAHRLGVERLVLTSHDPSRTDSEIDDVLASARRRFPLVEAAHEGMRITA